MPLYTPDAGLEQLANNIIKAHYPKLEVLKIAYLFREQAPISGGKVTCGMTYRCDDRQYALHHHDFVIEIGKDVWDDASDDFRRALMDHELAHVGLVLDEGGVPIRDEKTSRLKVCVNKHDVEEFEVILDRHGPYHTDLRRFLAAFARKKELEKKSKKGGDESLDAE